MPAKDLNKKVSFVTTVKDEGDKIQEFLGSLASQSLAAAEIIIVDGGSEDDTIAHIKSFQNTSSLPIKLIIAEKANIAKGRNIGIREASYEIIAVSDCGCKLHKDWLLNITKPFYEYDDLAVVSGFYLPECHSLLELSIAAATVPTLSEVNPESFLPSSRSVAFKKLAWQKVGGYPEHIDHAEDTVFDLKLRAMGFKFKFVAEAVVYWRMRHSFRTLFKQFFNYAKGDALAGLWFPRYYKIFIPFALLLIFGLFKPLIGGLVLLGLFLFYIIRQCYRGYRRVKQLKVLLLLPAVILTLDLATICGYTYGQLLSFLKKRKFRLT